MARMLFCDAFSNIFAKEFLTSNRALLIEKTNIPFLSIKGGLFFSGPWGGGVIEKLYFYCIGTWDEHQTLFVSSNTIDMPTTNPIWYKAYW